MTAKVFRNDSLKPVKPNARTLQNVIPVTTCVPTEVVEKLQQAEDLRLRANYTRESRALLIWTYTIHPKEKPTEHSPKNLSLKPHIP